MEGHINITNALAEFCCPIEIAPVTIKGTKLLTSRWEAIVNAIPEKNLSTTLQPILEILDQKVLLSWPGSPATCIQCLSIGHLWKNCPKRARTAPTPKQGATQPQQKPIPAKTGQTYAGAVSQKAPEQQNPNAEKTTGTPQKKEYQGPTGLNDPPQAAADNQITEPIRPETPNLNQSVIPTYDAKSPFNADSQYQTTSNTTYQVTSNNKKRIIYSSPSGSPLIASTTNILQKLTNTTNPENPESSMF